MARAGHAQRGRATGGARDVGDNVWDALKFKNPLAFPMTTGPAMVTANGRFNGQRTSYWVNSGEETVLRVEKSLSVRTRATENEQLKDAGTRELVWIGGRQYRKATVDGELTVSNHRKEAIASLVIRRVALLRRTDRGRRFCRNRRLPRGRGVLGQQAWPGTALDAAAPKGAVRRRN